MQIIDENGVDVTPLPLVLTDQNLARCEPLPTCYINASLAGVFHCRKNQGGVFGDQAATVSLTYSQMLNRLFLTAARLSVSVCVWR